MKVYLLLKISRENKTDKRAVMDIFLIRKHAEDMKKGLLAHATGLRYKIEPWETAD